MKLSVAGFLLVLALASNCAHGAPPFTPKLATTLTLEQILPKDLTRLRVTVTSEEPEPDTQVRLGNVIACSASACYQAENTPANIDVANTENGTGTFIAEMGVPYVSIESLYFEPATGIKSVGGSIKLDKPLTLVWHGGEIFVTLKKSYLNQQAVYTPHLAGQMQLGIPNEDRPAIYYNPKFATVAKLPLQTTISIPPGSTDGPTVFRAKVHNTGDKFPVLHIWPDIDFLKPATVESVELVQPWQLPGYTGQPPVQRIRGPRTSGLRYFDETGVPATYKTEIDHTGVLELDPEQPRSGQKHGTKKTSGANVADTSACIASLAARSAVNALPTGVMLLNDCAKVPPYVHIATASIQDKSRHMFIPTSSSGYIDDKPALNLLRLTDFTTLSHVAINGFVWEGDSGVSGGRGLAHGHVANTGRTIADNRQGGGYTSSYPGNSAGNKLVLRWSRTGEFTWEENAAVGPYDLSKYEYHISSSTSVVKKGVCAQDALVDRWSMIGTSDAGKLVFVSSTSTGKTSAAEMCPVLQRLGVTNAIRLDGGPSASMVVDGNLLNPLGSIVFGDQRHIAYGITLR
jgi:hypothetical protein